VFGAEAVGSKISLKWPTAIDAVGYGCTGAHPGVCSFHFSLLSLSPSSSTF
jgi:hypothetical protein